MKTRITIAILAYLSLATGCATAQVVANQQAAGVNQGIRDVRVKITTTKGEIDGVLFASKTPITVANFCNLSKRKYYDGIVFHRVIPEFMVQVGDPLTKQPGTEDRWGTGGPGYTFADEFRNDLKHDKPGVFSMANSGPRTNGSQIFITHVPTPHLDGRHTVFGQVTKGQNVINALTKGDHIIKVEIIDDTTALFESQARNIQKWNAVLKQR
jgi:peptidyl-prolyl cis-trans isomerase B (cyclophilin B)